MAELSPLPFSLLVARAFEEFENNGSIFDLPARSFYGGDPLFDTSVVVHGRLVSSPLGPAAGPHTQMAQNIVLAWLAGARVFELKTVQDNDRLTIPRPCIDVGGIGLNVEWSQELRIAQALEEYVKASMLIEMLAHSSIVPLVRGFDRWLFDVSVGYDLEGIRGARVSGFLEAMQHAAPVIDRLRHEIPYRWRHLREIDFPARVAASATISTFHGCPAAEVERIADYLMAEMGLDCSIKLNPTLLGREAVEEILHERLGLREIRLVPEAFATDLQWDDAVAMIARLQARAFDLGRSFAVKLTNTLVVENSSTFLPQSERHAYLSGAPLHVVAMHLVDRFRAFFGDTLPLSFSAGIDRTNVADAVALGLAPVTVCTDLLRQGGYARLKSHAGALIARMKESEARTIDELILRNGGAATRAGAVRKATRRYLESLARDRHYRGEHLAKRAGKSGRRLAMFDCSLCDLCISVCPNDANVKIPSLEGELAHAVLTRTNGEWKRSAVGSVRLSEPEQIATIDDLCNDCGNCEIHCADEGAPNRIKPRLFASEARWRAASHDGFYVEPRRVLARVEGREFALEEAGSGGAVLSGPSFRIRAAGEMFEGEGPEEIDLRVFGIMDYLRRAVHDRSRIHFLNCEPEIPCP